jgi:hypothetical protein
LPGVESLQNVELGELGKKIGDRLHEVALPRFRQV